MDFSIRLMHKIFGVSFGGFSNEVGLLWLGFWKVKSWNHDHIVGKSHRSIGLANLIDKHDGPVRRFRVTCILTFNFSSILFKFTVSYDCLVLEIEPRHLA